MHKRIRLRFGPEYGLKIITAPDEGTKVEIRLPFIEFTEENRKGLEQGNLFAGKKEAPEGGKSS